VDTYIYVQASDGTPLMPTKRKHHIQKLLKHGKACVIEHVPFVVRLKYKGPKNVQPLYGGTDSGRGNIGNAVIDSRGTVVYKDHVTTRNREIPKLMAARRTHRQASRRGERLARKRLARRLGTTTKKLLERMLPGCEKPVKVKDIINTEARFNNRKRPAGWITPTVRQLIQTHVNMVRRIRKFLPVDTWTLEINRFVFMRLDDGSVVGTDFQNGKLRGYKDEDDYIFHLQSGKCLCCGKEGIDHYHHIVPRSRGGSDRWYNKAGLCKQCHGMVHRGEISLAATGEKKRCAGISVLNQAVPYIAKALKEMLPAFDTCTGKDTHDIRELFDIVKDHAADAACIAAYGAPVSEILDCVHTYEVRQFRRHDRAKINNQRERTYCMEDPVTGKLKTVAKNRKPRFEQPGTSLADLGLTRQEISRLTVKKSIRYYNAAGRLMPGAEFFCNGGRYIMTGQLTGGKYLRAAGQGTKNFRRDTCGIRKKNCGLVYIS
jgi:5-methylcytosine-specific restriction endonuclease McrA